MARNVPLFLLYKTFFLFSQHRNRQLFNLVSFEAKTAMIAECRILSCNVIGIKKTEYMFLNKRCVISFNLFVDGNSVKQTFQAASD